MSSHLAWTLLRMVSINHTPCLYGNLVSVATRVKLLLFTPWKSQDGLLMFTSWKSQNGPRVKVGFCYLPPDRVNLAVKSKKETKGRVKLAVSSKKEMNSRAKMCKESRLLLFTPWKSQNETKVIMSCCCLPPDRVKLIVNSRVKMGCCCLSPLLSQTNSEQQKRNKQQGQNGQTVKMGFCYLPPERVKLTVNSK